MSDLNLVYAFAWRYMTRITDDTKGYICFQDHGSSLIYVEDDLVSIEREMRQTLTWLSDNCKEGWKWSFEDRPLWKCDDGILRLSPNPISGSTIYDQHRLMWISFDDKDDAMLACLSIVGLQGERHAFGGRMSRTSS